MNYSEQEVINMTPLGYKIKNYMKLNKAKGLIPASQMEFSEKVGCSYSHLSAIMSGKANPSMGLLAAIANEMNTSISELLKEV
jgi:transcriptional regulator with XRE-family HTH domain